MMGFWYVVVKHFSRITDAFVAVDPLTVFCGIKMSEAIDDMNAYIQLTDEVFYQILQYAGDEIPEEIEKVYNFVFLCFFF